MCQAMPTGLLVLEALRHLAHGSCDPSIERWLIETELREPLTTLVDLVKCAGEDRNRFAPPGCGLAQPMEQALMCAIQAAVTHPEDIRACLLTWLPPENCQAAEDALIASSDGLICASCRRQRGAGMAPNTPASRLSWPGACAAETFEAKRMQSPLSVSIGERA